MRFTDSAHCTSRAHCATCRADAAWRKAVGAPDECPHPVRGLGDVVESMIKPIARALRLNCLDNQGKLKAASPCAKRRDALNRAVPL